MRCHGKGSFTPSESERESDIANKLVTLFPMQLFTPNIKKKSLSLGVIEALGDMFLLAKQSAPSYSTKLSVIYMMNWEDSVTERGFEHWLSVGCAKEIVTDSAGSDQLNGIRFR